MADLGRDWLSLPGVEVMLDRHVGADPEADGALQNSQTTPGAGREPVPSPQAGWQGGLVERPGRAFDDQPRGQLGAVAPRAIKLGPETFCPPGLGEHPGAILERRLMADVLSMQTVKLGDPVTLVVPLETGDVAQQWVTRSMEDEFRSSSPIPRRRVHAPRRGCWASPLPRAILPATN